MANSLIEQLEGSKKIAIFSHIAPDADALCSSFALKNIIKNNYDYKYVDVFMDGDIGELYDPILRDEVLNPKPYNSYNMAFVLDCPNTGRIGKFQEVLKNIPFVVNIDHHESNDNFGNFNYVSSKVSSTCEFIYLIAKSQGLDIDNVIAKELYQGIITDTNCFTSLSLTKRTHQVVSELMDYKFDSEVIKEYYFKNNSVAKTKLLKTAFTSMKFLKNGRFTTMKIPYKTIEKVGASFEDTLGIVDNGININGTEVSALLIEKEPKYIYCSLRSKGLINVGEIAQFFGSKENGSGGGSEKVSAFQIHDEEIEEVERQLVEKVSPLLEDIETEDDIVF